MHVPVPIQWGVYQRVMKTACRVRDELASQKAQQEEALRNWQRYEDLKPAALRDNQNRPTVDTYVPTDHHLEIFIRYGCRMALHNYAARMVDKAVTAQAREDNSSASSSTGQDVAPTLAAVVSADKEYIDQRNLETKLNTSTLTRPLVTNRNRGKKSAEAKQRANASRLALRKRNKAEAKSGSVASTSSSVVAAPKRPEPGPPGRNLAVKPEPASQDDEEKVKQFEVLRRICPKTRSLYKDVFAASRPVSIDKSLSVDPLTLFEAVNNILKDSGCLAETKFAQAESKGTTPLQDVKQQTLGLLRTARQELNSFPLPELQDVQPLVDSDTDGEYHEYDASTQLWYVKEGLC